MRMCISFHKHNVRAQLSMTMLTIAVHTELHERLIFIVQFGCKLHIVIVALPCCTYIDDDEKADEASTANGR